MRGRLTVTDQKGLDGSDVRDGCKSSTGRCEGWMHRFGGPDVTVGE